MSVPQEPDANLASWTVQDCDDAAMLIRRLARRIEKLSPGDKTAEQAMGWLKRKGPEPRIIRAG